MRITVTEQRGRWVVQVARQHEPTLHFAYGSRNQARFFAAVFRLRPPSFPAAHRINAQVRRAAKADARAL
jgi:hypothetical protein